MVPHFATVLDGPISGIERCILGSEAAIERWFRLQWQEHAPPFYSSVDLRRAGFKLAPVDTNLYPGGWNNLTPGMLSLAVQAVVGMIPKLASRSASLLLMPENHTRNPFYLTNVAYLQSIFEQAGLKVRVGALNADIQKPTVIDLPSGYRVTLEPLVRQGGRLGLQDFDPEFILLNNDLSAGVPELLQDLTGQRLLPPLQAGWHVRRKSQHFKAYEEVSQEFAHMLGIDPWLIQPMFDQCRSVNFSEGQGVERVQAQVDTLLNRIQREYKKYGLSEKPFVVVKADNGTYGMGIMMVRDAKELDSLSRRARNKMAVIKDGQQVSDVIIQEGILTQERVHDATAEPVVYMMDHHVVGSFYRVHPARGIDENLNAPGAYFVPLEFARSTELPQLQNTEQDRPNRFYPYGVIARLAALAASRELRASPEVLSENCACV